VADHQRIAFSFLSFSRLDLFCVHDLRVLLPCLFCCFNEGPSRIRENVPEWETSNARRRSDFEARRSQLHG
jgi:hypothetical protein